MFPEISKPDYLRLNWEDLTEIQCETMFRLVSLFFFLWFWTRYPSIELQMKNINFNGRFQKHDMHRLLTALEIPEYYICVQRTHATGMEVLMILLRRLVYPARWCDLVPFFGRSGSEFSLIFNTVCAQ